MRRLQNINTGVVFAYNELLKARIGLDMVEVNDTGDMVVPEKKASAIPKVSIERPKVEPEVPVEEEPKKKTKKKAKKKEE